MCQLVEPFHVAEVLTVWQVCILRIHSVCHSEATGCWNDMSALEGVKVTIAIGHLEWFHQWLGGDPAPWRTQDMINNEVEY